MTDKMIKVKNRSASIVVYSIPENNIRREFAAGEEKRLNYDELEKLTYQPGGRELIENFLQVQEDEIVEQLNVHAEPEYYMSEEQVIELIKSGSQSAFLDALDYAPIGVIDLIKSYAVSIPMTDTEKRSALLEKTGFNVSTAISNIKAEQEPEVEEIKEETKNAAAAPSGRRTATNYKKTTTQPANAPKQYKVVSTTTTE